MANDPQNQPEHDEETAKAILRNYIFYERVFLERIYVPHRIPPDVASRYIREEVKQDARVEHINHACETARFYRLRDCLDHFAEFLNRNTDDVGDAYRSAESIDVLGDLGDEDQQKVAHDHWEKLTAHRRLDKVGERLAASFFHLAPGVSADPLSKELDKQQKEAAKNDDEDNPKPGDPDPDVLEDVLHGDLVQAVSAKRQKDMVLGTTRADRRAHGLARIYLGMVDFVQLGQDWAAYELKAEATERSSNATVVQAVRQALEDFQKVDLGTDDPGLVTETNEDTLARAYDAIAFFGGELTEDEQKFLGGDVPANPFTPT